MNVAMCRGTPSMQPPPTQNTAPVLDFNCLYTHDLRRKQKRWQDGFLRYHTFNKRVMVYDVSRNFVGDTHWTTGEELQDGDEVMLEKDGVLVQVAESVGRTETDLTELRRSAKKVLSERGSSPPARPAQTLSPRMVASRPTTVQGAKAPVPLKHRSLNALLGPSKGPIGHAVLHGKSPYEERQHGTENSEWEVGRPPKRQRTDGRKAGDLRPDMPTMSVRRREGTPQSLSITTVARKVTQAKPLQQNSPTCVYVDLSNDHNEGQSQAFLTGFPSDAVRPLSSSPPREPVPGRSSSPAFQTQRVPESARRPLGSPLGSERCRTHIMPKSSKLIQVKNDADMAKERTVVQKERRSDVESIDEPAPQGKLPTGHGDHDVRAQTLRLTSLPSKKNRLVCQEQLSSKPVRSSSSDAHRAAEALMSVTSDKEEKMSMNSQVRKLKARLARIDQKASPPETDDTVHSDHRSKSVTEPVVDPPQDAQRHTRNSKEHSELISYELGALRLAILDQAILPIPRRGMEDQIKPTNVSDSRAQQHVATHEAETVGNPNGRHTQPRLQRSVSPKGSHTERLPSIPESPPAEISVREAVPAPSAQFAAVDNVLQRITPPRTEQTDAVAPEGFPRADKDERPFRRAVSETSILTAKQPESVPGAPSKLTRATPQDKESLGTFSMRDDTQTIDTISKSQKIPSTRSKKPLQRAVTYNVAANGTATVMLSKKFQPPKPPSDSRDTAPPPEPDAWSREAFDLFTWRPPGWNEDEWRLGLIDGAGERVAM